MVIKKQTYDALDFDTIQEVSKLQHLYDLPKFNNVKIDGAYFEQCILLEVQNPLIFKQVVELSETKIICEFFQPIYYKVRIPEEKAEKISNEIKMSFRYKDGYAYIIICFSKYEVSLKDNKDS